MDTSQETPTQVNEDRDYSAFYEAAPSSPTDKPTQQRTGETRTLQAGDTGAVNFSNFSDHVRPSSQASEDEGFDTTRGEWRTADGTSQLNSNAAAYTPYKTHGLQPETPALPKNPFAAKSNGAVPFAASQLFAQTQQVSSAVKASPTSSRPSPNLLLNSISPNVFETSPLKNRANVSSPTDIRTSSPSRLHEIPATVAKNRVGVAVQEEDPIEGRSSREDRVPESPTISSRAAPGREPLSHYEPMRESQERKTSGDGQVIDVNVDDDYDEAFLQRERRKRAERKRAQAAQEMEKISIARLSRRNSSDNPTRKKRRLNSMGEITSKPLPDGRSKQQDQVVGDSQKAPTTSAETPLESTKATPGEEPAQTPARDSNADAEPERSREMALLEEDLIPATSPMQFSPPGNVQGVQPASEPDLPILMERNEYPNGEANTAESSSLPPIRSRRRTYGKLNKRPHRGHLLSSSASDPLQAKAVDELCPPVPSLASPTSTASTVVPSKAKDEHTHAYGADEEPNNAIEDGPPSDSKLPSSDPVQRRGRRARRPIETPQPRSKEPMTVPSSSLTTLSATPLASSSTTPGTQISPVSSRKGAVQTTSPANSKNLRKRALRGAVGSLSPQPTRPASARRSMRLDSDSTDELHHSQPGSLLERSLAASKSGRSFRQSMTTSHRGPRLFDGMVFALSFLSAKQEQQRSKLEARILQAGGMILKDGFQELFEQPAVTNTAASAAEETDPLKLTKAAAQCGFTALIADGHSRTAKYMQALALGLPCLAPRWVTSCLDKGDILKWEPYLLSAGVSAVLGQATRSRLLAPYSAPDAALVDTMDNREKLLRDRTVLVVADTKKMKKQTRQQYMFLVQALGPARLSRATTADQARAALKKCEQASEPFDWLYVDDSVGAVDAILIPPTKTGSKKRRKSAAQEPLGGYLHVLTDEIVIQSLIMGQMVDKDDMDS
ncbi:radiation sensitive protein rad9, variant 2 [Purpureocillium takamizusanense]|nr:radiation sensitive protein rad9, variant 2 [Purpureocillium takamizusanense]UNI18629.1 radiation sensitive protein rad9, variant 2 [Purpureocillium takamizusanense]